jgi:iron complex transport system substrate-binding protein
LGRAEWIKFFGALYDRDSIANNYFKGIETTYLALITKASYTKSKPSILVGSLFQNVWYAAAGENFLAQMIRDAGGNYLWKETKGNGSLALSIESVLDKAKNADIWIAPGNYESTNSLFEANSIYKEFKPFHTKSIYSYAHLKGKTGGIIYFESSPLHPDWVLEDLIQIFHPDLKLERDLHFFKKIE